MATKDWFFGLAPQKRVIWVLALLLVLSFIAISGAYAGNKALQYYFNPTRDNPEGSILVFSASWCPYCTKLKRLLEEARFPFEEIDIESGWEADMAYKSLKSHGVPVVVIGKDILSGGIAEQMTLIRETCESQNEGKQYDCSKLHF